MLITSASPQQGLLQAILKDLDELNKVGNHNLQIYWEDKHTEYSPERVDPCPDYYGMYSIVTETGEKIGDYYDIHQLDEAIFLLSCYAEYLCNK